MKRIKQLYIFKSRNTLFLLSILLLGSCVTTKKFEELNSRVQLLEKRPYFQLEDIDNDGVLNYYDPDIDGDGLVNSDDDDIDGDGVLNTLDNCPAVFGAKENNGCKK